jgi:hypothetical protein
MVQCNKIIEIFEGHYQVILDSPSKLDVLKIIDKSYDFVWGVSHIENAIEWAKYDHSLYGNNCSALNVFSRNISMEYLISTKDFVKLVPYINQTIKIIQTNIQPPYYLNLQNLSGKSKYDLLKSKVDYLFEIEIPGAVDYSPIISPSIIFLEKVIRLLS